MQDSYSFLGAEGVGFFGMLLIGCPLEKARQIADDANRAVEDYRFVPLPLQMAGGKEKCDHSLTTEESGGLRERRP